jgi:hypothetical protein
MPGAWSKKEAADFEGALSALRSIDEEIWK